MFHVKHFCRRPRIYAGFKGFNVQKTLLFMLFWAAFLHRLPFQSKKIWLAARRLKNTGKTKSLFCTVTLCKRDEIIIPRYHSFLVKRPSRRHLSMPLSVTGEPVRVYSALNPFDRKLRDDLWCSSRSVLQRPTALFAEKKHFYSLQRFYLLKTF